MREKKKKKSVNDWPTCNIQFVYRCKSGPIEIIRLRNIEQQPLELRLCSVRDSIELSDDAAFLTYEFHCFS